MPIDIQLHELKKPQELNFLKRSGRLKVSKLFATFVALRTEPIICGSRSLAEVTSVIAEIQHNCPAKGQREQIRCNVQGLGTLT